MDVKVEKLEKSMAKITVTLEPEKVDEAIVKAYHKVKNQISMPGFRKGKVPQKMIEKTYGAEVFYEDAANFMINESYPEAYDEASKEVEITSQPSVEDMDIEKGKAFTYVVTVATKPEVTLGEYKGIEYTKTDVTVTDEEVNEEIEKARELNSRRVPVEGRPAQMGDIADIDFDGYVDGKQFDGGKAEGYTITLGSKSFIDTFEDQICGHNIGDEFDVNVTFPADYQAADLSGKAAVFKCKLNDLKVKEIPELDDEFAADVSDFDTLDEYRADIRKNLEDRKNETAKANAQREIVKKIAEAATMEVADPMVEVQMRQHADEFSFRMQSQGIPMDQYLQLVGQTPETFMEGLRAPALQTIRERLALEAIAKAEGIEVTDEDVDAEIQKMADAYKMDLEKAKEMLSDQEIENMKEEIAANKAADFVYENGVAVEKAEEEEAKAEETKEEDAAE